MKCPTNCEYYHWDGVSYGEEVMCRHSLHSHTTRVGHMTKTCPEREIRILRKMFTWADCIDESGRDYLRQEAESVVDAS